MTKITTGAANPTLTGANNQAFAQLFRTNTTTNAAGQKVRENQRWFIEDSSLTEGWELEGEIWMEGGNNNSASSGTRVNGSDNLVHITSGTIVQPEAVPEPTTMLGLAVAGMGGAAIKRRQAQLVKKS